MLRLIIIIMVTSISHSLEMLSNHVLILAQFRYCRVYTEKEAAGYYLYRGWQDYVIQVNSNWQTPDTRQLVRSTWSPTVDFSVLYGGSLASKAHKLWLCPQSCNLWVHKTVVMSTQLESCPHCCNCVRTIVIICPHTCIFAGLILIMPT